VSGGWIVAAALVICAAAVLGYVELEHRVAEWWHRRGKSRRMR
jgi:hypothetical protein